MTPSAAPGLLAFCRRRRALGVWLFVALLGLVAAERRLAETHFNVRAVGPGFESSDLDGDEIRVRLVVLNDDNPPALPATRGRITFEAVHVVTQRLDFRAPGPPAPRGPPPPVLLAA